MSTFTLAISCLTNRVPDELWMEVRDIVQETGIKTIPLEKKGKKAKWLSGEALQIMNHVLLLLFLFLTISLVAS